MTMTSDTLQPLAVPRVVVTPPPPSPPLSLFHLAPPPQPHLPVAYTPADTLQDFHVQESHYGQTCYCSSAPNRAKPAAMKEKRVRFKLESSFQPVALTNNREKKPKFCQELANACNDDLNKSKGFNKASAKINDPMAQSDDDARSFETREVVKQTKNRLRRILGKFMEGLDVKNADQAVISAPNQRKSKIDILIGNGEKKSRSDESVGLAEVERPKEADVHSVKKSAPRPHSVPSSSSSPKKSGLLNRAPVITQGNSVSPLTSRPHSSDVSGGDRTDMINVHLYRLASKHQHQVYCEKLRQELVVRRKGVPPTESLGDSDVVGVDSSQDQILCVSSRSIQDKGDDDSRSVSAGVKIPRDLGSNLQEESTVPTDFTKKNYMGVHDPGIRSSPTVQSYESRRRRSQSAPPRNAASVSFNHSPPTENIDKLGYRITKAEFRRLTEQVRDVDTIIRSRFRKPAFTSTSKEKISRLAPVASSEQETRTPKWNMDMEDSLLSCPTRQWYPLSSTIAQEAPQAVSHKTVPNRPLTVHGSRWSNITLNTLQRPCSTPSRLHGAQYDPDHLRKTPATAGHSAQYEGLKERGIVSVQCKSPTESPAALSETSSGNASDVHSETKSVKNGVKQSPKWNVSDDVSTTSGIESDGCDCDDDISEDDEVGEDNCDSSDSENEGFEPSLDDIRRKMPHPQNLFRLRPDTLDAVYHPEDQQDKGRSDVQQDSDGLFAYPFKCLLPGPLEEINLRLCAEERTQWRELAGTSLSKDTALQSLMDRLVELEKQQLTTETWENRKLRGRVRRQERLVLNNNNSSSRANSGRQRDKRCCGLCLQAGCVGNCLLDKRQIPGRCEWCRLPLYPCQDNVSHHGLPNAFSYDSLNSRDRTPPPPPCSPVKVFCSCQRRRNTRLAMVNSQSLTRPKSTQVTRTKPASRSRDIRPTTATILTSTMPKDFEQSGGESQQRAPSNKLFNCRMRSSVLPVKQCNKFNRRNLVADSFSRKKKNKVPKIVS